MVFGTALYLLSEDVVGARSGLGLRESLRSPPNVERLVQDGWPPAHAVARGHALALLKSFIIQAEEQQRGS